MITTSRAIYFGTAKMIKIQTKTTIIKSIHQILNTYQERGFKLNQYLKTGNSYALEEPWSYKA